MITQFEEMRLLLDRKESAEWKLDPHIGFVFLLLLALSLLRFSTQFDNTLFYDEAVNLTIGEDILNGDFSSHATSWTFGSYLFPMVVASVYDLGGMVAVNSVLILLNIFTMLMIYAVTRQLFGKNAALWALVLLGLTSASLSLSQLAVYDALAVPLLAAALYAVVRSSELASSSQSKWLLAAGVFAGLAVLSKYIVLLFLPALLLVGLGVYVWRGRSVMPILFIAVPVAGAIITAYGLYFFNDLLNVLQNQREFLSVAAQRDDILRVFFSQNGLVMMLAWVGGTVLLYHALRNVGPAARMLILIFYVLFFAAILITPMQHLLTRNIQSMWKHNLYLQLFLVPLAAYILAALSSDGFASLGRYSSAVRLIAVAVFTLLFSISAQQSMESTWGLQHSWPRVSGVLNYLEQHPVTYDSRILAEQSSIYDYYDNLGEGDQDVWSSTFSFDYEQTSGIPAMVAAIEDHYFDLVILDNYYTPQENIPIRQALLAEDYELVYMDLPQVLSTGQTITIQVYAKPGSDR